MVKKESFLKIFRIMQIKECILIKGIASKNNKSRHKKGKLKQI